MKTRWLVLSLITIAGISSCSLGPEQKMDEEWFSVTFPKGWKTVSKFDTEYNYGTEYEYKTAWEGTPFNSEVMDFEVYSIPKNEGLADRDPEDRIKEETWDHLYKQINPGGNMNEYEYESEDWDQRFKFIDFKGVKTLEHIYVEINEPFEPKKGPRSSYYKGRMLAFDCKGQWIIIHMRTFESDWDRLQPKYQEILDTFTPKCN